MAPFWKRGEGEPEAEKPKEEATPPPAPPPPVKEGEFPVQEDEAGRLGKTAEERAMELEALEAAEAREEKVPGVEELVLKLEKVEGRLEATETARIDMADRLQRMSEQIGELRTIALERERTMGVLEADFELIKSVFEEVKPSEIGKELDRKERSISQLGVRVEKVERVLDRFTEEVRTFRETLDKVKGVENLVEMGQRLREQADRTEDAKKYVDRMAAKVESIFGELSTRLMTLDTLVGKVEGLEEFSRDATKALDDVGTKLKGLASTEELRAYLTKEELEKRFVNFQRSLEERLTPLAAAVREFQTALQEGLRANAQEVAGLEARIAKIEKPSKALYAELDAIKERLASVAKKQDIETLLKERERILATGDRELLASIEAQIEEARTLGRLLRMVEEQGESLARLARAALVDEDTLEKWRQKIREEDIGALKRDLEDRIRRLEIPKEVRRSLQKEAAAEASGAVKEELRRAELLLEKKLESAERLRKRMEEMVGNVPGEVKAQTEGLRASLDAAASKAERLERELIELKTRFDSLEGKRMDQLSLRLDALAQDVAGLKSRNRSAEDLLREKEALLSTLETLRLKKEAGFISREIYETSLNADLGRLSEIDARLEEIARLDQARKKAEEAERAVRELADICKTFPTREDLDKLREAIRTEEMAQVQARAEKAFGEAQRALESQVAEARFSLQRLNDMAQKLVDRETLQSALAQSQKEVLQKTEALLDPRLARVQAAVERKEAGLREEMEALRREVGRRLERVPAEMEARFMDLELRLRDAAQAREALERRLGELQREFLFVQQRSQKRSLDDLLREREQLRSLIQGSR